MTHPLPVLMQNTLLGRQTISPLHQYSGSHVVQLVGSTGKASCSVPQEQNEMRARVTNAFRELSLSSAQVFDQYKRTFWSEDEKGCQEVTRQRGSAASLIISSLARLILLHPVPTLCLVSVRTMTCQYYFDAAAKD